MRSPYPFVNKQPVVEKIISESIVPKSESEINHIRHKKLKYFKKSGSVLAFRVFFNTDADADTDADTDMELHRIVIDTVFVNGIPSESKIINVKKCFCITDFDGDCISDVTV
jgi:hypothetical protein